MTLAEVVSITGMPGLYKIVNKRSDGLIVTSLVDDKTQFVSGRTHLFSTLDNITMYTQEDNKELRLILIEIKKLEKEVKPESIKSDSEVKAFFEKVLPDYDREKVYISDMKKLVKWYNILNGKKLIDELISEPSETVATTATEEGAEEKTEKATKAKKAAATGDSKPKKEVKPKVEKTVKANTKVAAPKKVTTPRKAS
jgi:hypothetical protein